MNLSDLLLHPSENEDLDTYEPWRPLHGEGLSVLHVTVFGNLFLTDTIGQVWLLDSWSGQLLGVSANYEEFRSQVANDSEFSRSWLLTDFLALLNSSGLTRSKGQVFSPYTSPALGGSLTPENFCLAPLHVYLTISAQEALALHAAS